jgi:formamidase
MKSPLYLPGPVEPHYGPGRYLTFEGFSVDQHGKQHYMDVTVAYRQTILRMSARSRPWRGTLLMLTYPRLY